MVLHTQLTVNLNIYTGASAPFFILMTVVSYGASTELDAVNSILMSVGESPVNTLSVQSPEVVIAQKTLQQVCREILSEGWKFNTETQYPITLESNKHCHIPNNVLQIDLNRFRHPDAFDTVRKTDSGVQKLYDLQENELLQQIEKSAEYLESYAA